MQLQNIIDRFISAKMEDKKMQKSGIFTKIKTPILIGGLFSAFFILYLIFLYIASSLFARKFRA